MTDNQKEIYQQRREERKRLQDIKDYGAPESRNRGKILVTKTVLLDRLYGTYPLALPARTRLVDLEFDGLVGTLIVESPDIAPPNDHGELPVVSTDCKLHYVSRDAVAGCLNIIEYVVSAQWEGQPESLNARFVTTGSPQRFASLAQESAAGDSEALKTCQALTAADIGGAAENWVDIADGLPEDKVRPLLAVMLKAFWGPFTKTTTPQQKA